MSEEEIMLQTPKKFGQLRRLAKDKIADKWKSIAIQLGFTPAQIKVIEDNHKQRPVQDCCTEMLFKWVDGRKNQTTEDLIQAVKDVGYAYQAEQFKKGS